MAYKSRYRPSNPQKYNGDPTKIVSRSLWERDVMYHLDHNPNVLKWSSEEVIVPYISPLDSKMHRYFVDFWIRIRLPDGTIKESLIEVKPQKETVEPKKPATKSSTSSRRYAKQAAKYMVNEAKWIAAQEFCESTGMEFKIMTEYDIYGPKGKKYTHGNKQNKTNKR